MKLFQAYKKIVSDIGPLEIAWFCTFNVDPALVEKFILPYMVEREPTEVNTAEDFEALNRELSDKNINVKIWYDYRALDLRSSKRTTIDFIPVDPAELYKTDKTEAIFHPKIIFLKGKENAYLITGSANLSIAAWSTNLECAIIKEIDNKLNANEIISFFESLGESTRPLNKWASSLPDKETNWHFIHSIHPHFNLFNHLEKEELTIWSPYYSKKTSKLLETLLGNGFPIINLVPDISSSGEVKIIPKELEKIKRNDRIRILKPVTWDDKQGLHHAKVWLSSRKLAIGSWNCSYRATGIDIAEKEKNIEAGIIIDSDPKTEDTLLNELTLANLEIIKGISEEEKANEWEDVLNKFTINILITANWETFRYEFPKDDIDTDLLVSLPHNPNEKILIKEVNNYSFRSHYKRVLKDKSFSVFDQQNNLVYHGYLLETGKEKRPVYGYESLHDLLDSLIENPIGETARKQCQYKLETESTDAKEDYFTEFHYSGSESYYFMFVCFQKLFDKIDECKTNRLKLDQLGFRLPSSLINIKLLAEESIQNALKQNDEDSLLFHYFLIQEINKCIQAFNKFNIWGGENIEDLNIESVKKELKLDKKDHNFLKILKNEFGYATI